MTKVNEAEAARYARRRLRAALVPATPRGAAAATLLAVLLVTGSVLVERITGTPDRVAISDGTAVLTPDGGSYVVDAGIAYPTVNAVSARLGADRVVRAPASALDGMTRGTPRGIRGAPAELPPSSGLVGPQWQLCTGADGVVVLAFSAAAYLSPPAREQTVLDDGRSLWVVRDGRRTPLNGLPPVAPVATRPELVSLLPLSLDSQDVAVPAGTTGSPVVCAQSDPTAPFARPSSAAVQRAAALGASVVIGTGQSAVHLSLPAAGGVLATREDGGGYWLLTSSGELNPVADDRALGRLGYSSASAVSLPAGLLALLPAGPELSIEAAGHTPI